MDYDDDYEVGFVISHAEDIEDIGWRGIVKLIRETVGDNPVYSAYICLFLNLDIDHLNLNSHPGYRRLGPWIGTCVSSLSCFVLIAQATNSILFAAPGRTCDMPPEY